MTDPQVEEWLAQFLGASEAYFIDFLKEDSGRTGKELLVEGLAECLDAAR